MHRRLQEVAEQYARVKQLVIDLEGDTAISGLTIRTVNDLRHALDHILIGVALEAESASTPAGTVEDHYTEAIGHLENYLVNSYEIISGKALRNLREKIDKAGPLTRTGRATALYKEAIAHYNRGRESRTENSAVSLDHFQQGAALAIEAGRAIEPATRGERRLVWWSILTGIITIASLGFALYVWLSPAGH